MSGFIGILRNKAQKMTNDEMNTFKQQNNVMIHRGPDDDGYYNDEYTTFGFRKLKTNDHVNETQPYRYQDGNIILLYDGSLYNCDELYRDLNKKGYEFSTTSELEVISALFCEYKEHAFQYLRGMFTIVIWDKEKKQMYGARDPFGIKPFFYSENSDGIYFASEKKSLLLNEETEEVNLKALQHYLSFQYVPEPETMTSGFQKLEPGHYFTVKPSGKMTIRRYWNASFKPIHMDKQEWIKRIQYVLDDSVERHMKSDVPVGSLLSGGIDSTLIVSLAKNYNPNIKTFSVGFAREGFSEIDVAKETADKLDVENISYIISPEEYVENLPKIMWYMDDPLADPSCVPLYFAAREAKKHVSIVLSGEGSDEFFGGYPIYHEPESLKIFNVIPKSIKHILAKIAQLLPEGIKGKSFIERGTTPLRERYIGNAKIFEETEKRYLLKTFNQAISYQQVTEKFYNKVANEPLVHQMQYIDLHTWVNGDILLKADRMSMANSLEIRSPFLDIEVFNIASKIPVHLKIANGTTKSILREASRGIIPDHVLDREKLGFPVPIRHWLKNELNSWAIKLIDESATDDLFNKQYIKSLLDQHCQGKRDYSRKIWTVLMFMLWHQIFVERKYDVEQFKQEKHEPTLTRAIGL